MRRWKTLHYAESVAMIPKRNYTFAMITKEK